MKKYIIKINDISEIDTSKITVYDLTNRYIDNDGNVYGLKYSKSKKKIEVIKLLRTDQKAAKIVNQEIIKKKIDDNDMNQIELEISENIIEREIEDISDFTPDPFLNEVMEKLGIHKDRLKGILMNLKNSNFINNEDKTNFIKQEDYFKTIENEVLERIQKIINYQNELKNYPRSITYYQSKLDNNAKEIFEKISSDPEKSKNFIYYYEMFHNFRNFYRQLKKILGNLLNFLDEYGSSNERTLARLESQHHEDAVTSLKTTIEESNDILDNLVKLEKYIFTFE